MRCAGKLMAYGMFAVMTLVVTQVQALDIAPVPPAIEGDVAVQQEVPASEPLPLPSVDQMSCTDVSNDCCAFQPSATCCGVEPYRCRCCGHVDCCAPGIHKRKRNGKICWCRYWTTGDMHQHYAYYPQYHGHYYFRPYNYTTVLEQKELIVAMGGDHSRPYSVEMFDNIYSDYYASNPIIEQPLIINKSDIPGASQLPLLEELLPE